MASPLNISSERDGALLRLCLARPKANIVDAEMIAALYRALAEGRDNQDIKAVLLSAEGPHFSFGASVEEHLPDQCASMLSSFHTLISSLFAFPVPVLVSVRGQCLGGGLEIASAGHLIFAAPDAHFGQPEIKLGLIAPAASCLLPLKIGQSRAEDLLLSGRSLNTVEAIEAGLVNFVADDPDAAALEYFDKNYAPLSAAALRHAVRAARLPLAEVVRKRIAAVETLYLEDLMATGDAVEGLNAFLEKRAPVWENR
jgi:cyclohexa-1,5-dienecarbonyl-CoA hydratase